MITFAAPKGKNVPVKSGENSENIAISIWLKIRLGADFLWEVLSNFEAQKKQGVPTLLISEKDNLGERDLNFLYIQRRV